MKTLYFIGGTMGVGKTTVCRELQKMLPKNVFLDGDWCWDMRPFTVNDETKHIVTDNICYMLNNFLGSEIFENVIFCWVMHEQEIIDELLSRLNLTDIRVINVSLTSNNETLRERLSKDISSGLRSGDIIERSIQRLPLYENLSTLKINTSHLTVQKTAEMIIKIGGNINANN